MSTAFITHSDCLLHDMGDHHPEQPARLKAVEDQLIASGLMNWLQHVDAPLARREHLERVHTPRHIASLERSAPTTGLVHLDPDTAMNPHTLTAALRAAGAAVLATDMVIEGKVESAFCNVRPPGHHAERGRAMGFCLFNNVAVAAAHALEAHGLERVAVVDFDVHHGNGTEDIFRDDPRVLMVSTFQHPFYPYSGLEGRSDRMVNVPLAAYSSGREFRAAVVTHWMPALEEFRPEMLFVSAGFDAHREDDMAMLNLVEDDYAWVTERIKEVADRYARGRIVSTLEGGYALHALGRSVTAHLKVIGEL
ncbi:MAG: histone deacetylase family protein [Betaproteobacteria bacterium]|nr:histone deacetylase family protein [Betaproteobacteria bacterium]